MDKMDCGILQSFYLRTDPGRGHIFIAKNNKQYIRALPKGAPYL